MARLRAHPAPSTTADLDAQIAELERERELLNAIANHAPSMLCLVDGDGRVRPYATNKAFERTLGYRPDETGGVLFWERYAPEPEREGTRTSILEAVRTGSITTFEGHWLQRTGDEIDVEWSCRPLPQIASGPVYLISGNDVTVRVRHEREMRQSRARIMAAADDARRKLERNLHDGAQQRLVALLIELRAARRGLVDPSTTINHAVEELAAAVRELRELAQGIHPSALSERGLPAAIRIVAARAPVPVELDVTSRELDPNIGAVAYYLVSEALANVAKYAQATRAAVRVRESDERLVVVVEDDGVGGAVPGGGSGLSGLIDRVAASDGVLQIESPRGGGTRLRAELPLPR